jgi:hypothetical protein
VAGVAADRIRRALSLSEDAAGALRVLELHPLLNPAKYVDADLTAGKLHVRPSPAHEDGSWISLCTPDAYVPLQAIVAAVNPNLDVQVEGTDTTWTASVIERSTPAKELSEVAVTKFSGGATFQFEPRRSLPLTVLN